MAPPTQFGQIIIAALVVVILGLAYLIAGNASYQSCVTSSAIPPSKFATSVRITENVGDCSKWNPFPQN